MTTDTENADLADRMTIWTMTGGNGGALIIMILMVTLSQSVGG
jgi:hypothetical protein